MPEIVGDVSIVFVPVPKEAEIALEIVVTP
jgi:hypothetical protein